MIKERLGRELLFFDGGMGTLLQDVYKRQDHNRLCGYS